MFCKFSFYKNLLHGFSLQQVEEGLLYEKKMTLHNCNNGSRYRAACFWTHLNRDKKYDYIHSLLCSGKPACAFV